MKLLAFPLPFQAEEKGHDFFSFAPDGGQEDRQPQMVSLGSFTEGRGRTASRRAGGAGERLVPPHLSFTLGEGDHAHGGEFCQG